MDIFSENIKFVAYTSEHWAPIVLMAVLFSLIIIISKKYLTTIFQRIVGLLFSLIATACVIGRMYLTFLEGNFTIQEELPLHLCRIISFVFPFVIFIKNRDWFGTLYFFATVGTIQSLIFPDLQYGFPHHSYLTYWLLHGVLFALPFYGMFVYNWRIKKKDFWNAVIVLNIYCILTFVTNYFLGSNYFYTMHKPVTSSPLDFFGPWPIYIFVVELIAVVLFYIAFLPFSRQNQ